DHEVVGLPLVVVPALHDLGVDDRQVDLAEALEKGIVVAQHLHEPAALVRDHLERLHEHALDHARLPREAATCGAARRGCFAARASPARPLPTPMCRQPCASTSAGGEMLRRSHSTGCFMSFFSRARSSVRDSFHSVMITSARAPRAAWWGSVASVPPASSGSWPAFSIATGSNATTASPARLSPARMRSDGAARMSSVLGLNASPSTATFLPRVLPTASHTFVT